MASGWFRGSVHALLWVGGLAACEPILLDVGSSDETGTEVDATPCTADSCSCPEENSCQLRCEPDPCELVCEPSGTCDFYCPTGGCTFVCHPHAECVIHCGGIGGCAIQCQPSSDCSVTCTDGCELECQPGAICSQTCQGSGCTCSGEC